MQQRIQPVLLVGGEGTRLAPVSTPDCPKPFIPLPEGGSLLQQTLGRVSHPMFAPPTLIGQERHRYAMHNHVGEMHIAPRAMLLEPKPCNTAMAVAVAVAWMIRQGEGDSVLAILPADHAIDDEMAWHDAVQQAAALAQRDVLVLIAMQPESASTGLGYMQLEDMRVIDFREKPPEAQALVDAGWKANSGQIIARAITLAEALKHHAPHIWAAALQSVVDAKPDHEFMVLGAKPYASLLPIAFDRAVLEKADNIHAVPCSCGWRDIGTLEAFLKHACLSIQDANPPRYERTDRPWGYGETIASTYNSIAKCLTLYPGRRLSLQRHKHRIEVWLVMQGEAEVQIEDYILALGQGESATIPQNAWHRLTNRGSVPLVLMELQIGVPDENDIERREDDYGRV